MDGLLVASKSRLASTGVCNGLGDPIASRLTVKIETTIVINGFVAK